MLLIAAAMSDLDGRHSDGCKTLLVGVLDSFRQWIYIFCAISFTDKSHIKIARAQHPQMTRLINNGWKKKKNTVGSGAGLGRAINAKMLDPPFICSVLTPTVFGLSIPNTGYSVNN